MFFILDDFKPASVDVNKMATVDVGTNNQVTVTVPHLGKFVQNHHIYVIYANNKNMFFILC